jgi:hypothetical protein
MLMCTLYSLQRKIGRFDAARATATAVLTRATIFQGRREAHNKLASGDAARALALSQESLAAAQIAAASWSNFNSPIAAMVQWRALTALHQNAAAKSWALALRERHKTALAEEAGYWHEVKLVLVN